jgi:hypothetical protein
MTPKSHRNLGSPLLTAILFAAMTLLASAPARAQYGSESHVGLMLGVGSGGGPAVDQSSLYTQGTVDTRGTAWGMVFKLEGSSDKDGLGFGYMFAGTLGGINEKSKLADLGPGYSAYDGVWGDDFDLIGDMRLGVSANYRVASRELLLKLRYFNWYNAGGLRAFHGNKDDPAALGLAASWKRLGVDLDYGSDKIPGVLVSARDWSLLRLEARYKVSIWDEGKMSWLAGLRYEGGFLQRGASATSPDTTVHSVIAFFSMAGN